MGAFTIQLLLGIVGFFLCLFIFLEIGRALGRRRLRLYGEHAAAGVGVLDGALFALFGLLVAFSFSGAVQRFDARRVLSVEEANTISTAWARLDLLPDPPRSALRDQFRAYLDSRLLTYRLLPDEAAARAEFDRSTRMLADIWTAAVAACAAHDHAPTYSLVLSPINSMSDIATSRAMAAKHHPPRIIFVMLFGVALVCSLLAGFSLGCAPRTTGRPWLHIIGFVAITAAVCYVIIDLEYPRRGLIRVDTVDDVLVQLRESMK